MEKELTGVKKDYHSIDRLIGAKRYDLAFTLLRGMNKSKIEAVTHIVDKAWGSGILLSTITSDRATGMPEIHYMPMLCIHINKTLFLARQYSESKMFVRVASRVTEEDVCSKQDWFSPEFKFSPEFLLGGIEVPDQNPIIFCDWLQKEAMHLIEKI